ncbi:solute carrier family 2, facilitated glucose transporter member 1 isoform X3 [Lingula anatina]|uniref:Solute carrier family 2, facilitated glucose transporter member 1 isoform X3 n=1 Tax=Lingula anatina TaxID=7574 RepID=A0A1S3KEV4_LINAN|nr:solute carrier family 2, facilitated glucose transporter member 1 isoform X3 [Lingula anatina]|eukprot:XP_013420984.1 solute carrier family 2, facilitated glucose transporter member 1 isoform X3 [Lingula anatina]
MEGSGTDPVLTERLKGRVTVPLVVTAFAAVIGGSFPHGYNTGVLNAPQDLIIQFLNDTYLIRTGNEPGKGMLNFVWSFTVAIYLVGGMFGAFSAGWFADRFGRKKAIIIMYIPTFVAAILFGLCDVAESFEMLIIARFIVGFGCGAGSGLVPMYMTEIAPVNIRGAMGVLHQLALTTGILVSQIFGLRQILGNENWPILLAFVGVPCLISAFILPWFPDSPRYTLIKLKKEKEAQEALQTFRGADHDVSADIEEMRREQKQLQKQPPWSLGKLFRSKMHRMPFMLVSALALAQQLSGINVVFYYSSSVFKDAGIPDDYVQYATLGTGIINVIMTVISVPLMEKSGRRILLLGGMILMLTSAVIITIALNLKDILPWMAYICVICMLLFVIGFAIGLGSIPQFIGAELFKQGPRPAAMSFGGMLNWLANTLVGISYPSMEDAMGPYSFIVFVALLLFFLILIWKFLPETKNKSFAEIAAHFGIKEDEMADAEDNKESVEMLPMHDRVGTRLAATAPANARQNGSHSMPTTHIPQVVIEDEANATNPTIGNPAINVTDDDFQQQPLISKEDSHRSPRKPNIPMDPEVGRPRSGQDVDKEVLA